MSLFDLLNLQLHNADEGTFATVEGSPTWRDLRITARPKIDPSQTWFDDPAIRQRLEERYPKIQGLKSVGALAPIQIPLCGTGTAAGDTVEADGATDCSDGQMLKNSFGGESLGTGTTVNDAGATTTGFTVASAAGLSEKQAVLCTTTAGLEANVIDTISTNDLTFVRAFTSAPANGSTVNASATYYPLTPSGTLQFRSLDAEAAAAFWTWLGCQLTAKLSALNPGEEPRVDLEGMVVSWAESSGGSLAMASYDHTTNASTPGLASELHIQNVATTTRNLIHHSNIAIDPGITYNAIPSASGVEGVQGYGRATWLPKIEITVNSFSADWFDDITSQQAAYLHYQIGSTAGETVLIEIPNMTLDAVPEKASVEGQNALSMKWTGRGLGTTETDLARAPIRLHRL
jgi:hypothetical protein